jgi:hypothetical protein
MGIRQAPEVKDKREDDAWLSRSCQGRRIAGREFELDHIHMIENLVVESSAYNQS